MNFDELQSAWNSDEGKDIVIPQNLEKLKAVKGPVERIRKNMRCELLGGVILFAALGFAPLLTKADVTTVPFIAMYFAVLLLSIYSYIKFYFFYKRLNVNALSSKDSLYELYYDIKLHIELYKFLSYCTIPILFLYFVMLGMNIMNTHKLTPHKTMVLFILMPAAFIIITTFLVILIEWWVKHAYGKYLKQVGAVLKELKEE